MSEALIREVIDRIGWRGRHTAFGPCEGYVYFVMTRRPGDLYVKIGFSRQDPRLRMASLQTGNHRHLRLLTFMPGCRNMERSLHEQFRRSRASGEWFRFTDEMVKEIEQHIIKHGAFANDPSLEQSW